MPMLTWDQTGERLYETGVDHGVLYVYDTDQNKKTPAFDMIGYLLMYDNPKRMIDFTHALRLLPQDQGYKY